jgi:hypothetical protein
MADPVFSVEYIAQLLSQRALDAETEDEFRSPKRIKLLPDQDKPAFEVIQATSTAAAEIPPESVIDCDCTFPLCFYFLTLSFYP